MIENYILMHKGGQEEYRDSVFVNYSSSLTMAILYLPTEAEFSVADEASVQAAESLLEEAKSRMSSAEDREPTPQEEMMSALASLM